MGVLNFAPHRLHQIGGRASLSDGGWQRRHSLRVIFFVPLGQKPLRGGTLNQRRVVHIDIIQDVLKTITALRHRYSVGPPEIPAIQVVFRNREATLVHQPMVARAQQQQNVEAGFAAGRPKREL